MSTSGSSARNAFDAATAGAIAKAVTAATRFLLGARNPDGWWQDFEMSVGGSDEYVTAYVASLLPEVGDRQVDEAVSQAWRLLVSRRGPGDGWGWNVAAPTDADSTGWGLQLAARVGASESARAESARQVVTGHFRPDGGVAVYRDGAFVQRAEDAWSRQSQACVTAAVAILPGFAEAAREFLRRSQLGDGSWAAYWWCDHEFATALAAQALAAGEGEDRQCVARAAQWALRRMGKRAYAAYPARPGGSPFASGCCLRILLLAGDLDGVQPPLTRGLAWLLANQRPDGSWSPSARLRIPPHAVADPDQDPRGTRVVIDRKRIFTTATVLAALQAASDSVPPAA